MLLRSGVSLLSDPRAGRSPLLSVAAFFIAITVATTLSAAVLTEVTELLAHPDQYDHQMVTVSGKVANFQLATNREGRPAYGFLLQSAAGTVKVVGLGKAEVREGDYVIVEGIFSRLRQAGRTIVYNEIKATSVQSMTRMNPDLVG
ncbi:MAG TPA: hypothetical protein VHF07_08020 [Nitrospiraceae bacterium]|nr:hypothetical protein [Nitrospiraceae bacterium]